MFMENVTFYKTKIEWNTHNTDIQKLITFDCDKLLVLNFILFLVQEKVSFTTVWGESVFPNVHGPAYCA